MIWSPHKLLEIPSDEEIAVSEPDDLIDLHMMREEAISNEAKDKYRYGFKFDNWHRLEAELENHSEALVSGGNRSSKTQVGAYLTVKAALTNPKATIFCFAQNSEVSIRQQQSAVYDWLPMEYKQKQTSSNTYISYSAKNGFTDSSFILPNGSQVIFKYYSQFANNPTILEGAELGSLYPECVNIGAWCDEYLGGCNCQEEWENS